jgi:hypothetical protein
VGEIPPDAVLLVQVHIPRSAGTSVRNWLRFAAEAGHTNGHVDLYPPHTVSGEEQFRLGGLANPRVTTMSSHNVRSFPSILCGRPTQYFTIIREPLEQFASLVRYMLENREKFQVPRRLKTQRDVAEWFIDARFGELGAENMQTNHLALYPWCETTGGRCDPEAYGLWPAEDYRAYWDERLTVAKRVLSTFLCVGVFDRTAESMHLLVERSRAYGIQLLPAAELPVLNTTERSTDDESWLDPSTPLGELIARSLSDDFKLYEHASAMLAEALAAQRAR